MPMLIDAGMSPRGWSFRSALLACAQEWAYTYPLGHRTESVPLVRGSLVHAGLAHYRARLQATQQGWDAEAYHTPDDAIEIIAEREDDSRIGRGLSPLWRDHIAVAKQTVRTREAHDRAEGCPEILAVEHLLAEWFDATGIVDAPPDADARIALMGQGIEGWRKLAAMGPPYLHSARADWIYRSNGYVYIADTKTAFKVDRTKIDGYTMSGQMLGLTAFGLHAYGEVFGGISIDFAVLSSQTILTRRLPSAPNAVRDFPAMIVESEERLARLLLEDRPLDRYPKALNEQVCVRRYGPRCPHFERCRLGV